MISQERLLQHVHVLSADNEMYHETNLKLSFELNGVMFKADCMTANVERSDRMLGIGNHFESRMVLAL